MVDFTTVIAVDEPHLAELRLSAPTWRAHKPELWERPMVVMCDGYGYSRQYESAVSHVWAANLAFLKHPALRIVLWEMPTAANQREKMLTAFMGALQHVDTPWFLKIDTDAVATYPGPWIDDAWFARRPAFVGSPWSYTKPADAIARLDDWGDTVPGICEHPRLDLPVTPNSDLVRHRRLISWCMFGNTEWTRRMYSFCRDGRLPVPSQDTFLFYCAERRRDHYILTKMSRQGWRHVTGHRLPKACEEALASPSTDALCQPSPTQ